MRDDDVRASLFAQLAIKGFQRREIHVPERRTRRPDREPLAALFERFRR